MNFHHDSVAATVRVRRPSIDGPQGSPGVFGKARPRTAVARAAIRSDAGIMVWRCETVAATDY